MHRRDILRAMLVLPLAAACGGRVNSVVIRLGAGSDPITLAHLLKNNGVVTLAHRQFRERSGEVVVAAYGEHLEMDPGQEQYYLVWVDGTLAGSFQQKVHPGQRVLISAEAFDPNLAG